MLPSGWPPGLPPRAPNGEHLIEIVRHSDAAFDTIMLLAGRKEVVAARKLAEARDTLVAMLELVVDLTA